MTAIQLNHIGTAQPPIMAYPIYLIGQAIRYIALGKRPPLGKLAKRPRDKTAN